MSTLTKTISGRIYSNEFTTSTLDELLTVSPSNGYYSLTDRAGYLRINGSNGDVKILLDPIVREYTIIAKVDYIPTSGNSAGLILYKDEDNYAEFKSYPSTTSDVGVVYTHLKIVRDKTTISFYGSPGNNVWKLFGVLNVEDLSLLVGFFATGTQDFDIEKIDIYKSSSLVVTNIPAGYLVKIYDENLAEISSAYPSVDGIVSLSIEESFMGMIAVYTNQLLLAADSEVLLLSNGDEYQYDINIEVYMQNPDYLVWELLTPLSIINLGFFEAATMDRKLSIKNIDTTVIEMLDISIKPNTIFKKGYNAAGLTVTDEDLSDNTYSKVIQGINIQPNETFEFSMRINRDGNSISIPDYAFNISVRAW